MGDEDDIDWQGVRDALERDVPADVKEAAAKLKDVKIEMVEIPAGPNQRKLDPSKWRVEITRGPELETPEGDVIRVLREGDRVVADTLFGPVRGQVEKDEDAWFVEDEYQVALIDWDEGRECFYVMGSFSQEVARKLSSMTVKRSEG